MFSSTTFFLKNIHMDTDINVNNNPKNIDMITLQKMAFIYNALEKGWTVKKNNNLYIFKKNHEGKKEVFLMNI